MNLGLKNCNVSYSEFLPNAIRTVRGDKSWLNLLGYKSHQNYNHGKVYVHAYQCGKKRIVNKKPEINLTFTDPEFGFEYSLKNLSETESNTWKAHWSLECKPSGNNYDLTFIFISNIIIDKLQAAICDKFWLLHLFQNHGRVELQDYEVWSERLTRSQ